MIHAKPVGCQRVFIPAQCVDFVASEVEIGACQADDRLAIGTGRA